MNNNQDRTILTDLTIKDKKKEHQGYIRQVTVFASTKIVEVETRMKERYYLVFYRDTFIFGAQLSALQPNCFIERARKIGINLKKNHPLIPSLVTSKLITIPNKKQLFTQLQRNFTSQKAALIVTTLDSFYPKEIIIDFIDKLFSRFRQDGKFFKAYEILQILTRFIPENQSVKNRLHALEFHKYQKIYEPQHLELMCEKDSLYAEYYSFENRKNSSYRNVLKQLYQEKQNQLSLILLWLEEGRSNQHDVVDYTKRVLSYITMKKWLIVLQHAHINPFLMLPNESIDCIKRLFEEEKYETAALLLFNNVEQLPASFKPLLHELWQKLDSKFILSHLDNLTPIIHDLVTDQEWNQAESMVQQLTISLLENHEFPYVYEKIISLQKNFPQSIVIQKMKKMHEILEDPDRMMELGRYYAEFNQIDQAIDCFFWEMELKPQDPKPVSQLIKMYQRKGMVKEASAYQQILQQLSDEHTERLG